MLYSLSVISSRIISIRIKASKINITIIQVYALTTSHSDEEIEEFYETIEKTISDSPKKDFLIVGDYKVTGMPKLENTQYGMDVWTI